MSKIKVRLDEADLDQLRTFATSKGIDYAKTANSARLIGLIKHSGHESDFIEYETAVEVSRGKPKGDDKVMASSLPAELFLRRDLGQADAVLVKAAGRSEKEVDRLRSEGAIFIDDMAEEDVKSLRSRIAELKKARDQRDNSWVTVQIAETREEGALKMVPVSVNGSALWIKRGVRSMIRYPYFMALQALEVVIEKDDQDRPIGERVTPSYPVTVHDGPDIPDLLDQAA